MSQATIQNLIASATDGTQLAALLNPAFDALRTWHSGTTRPTYATQGSSWMDVSSQPWVVKIVDGTEDIPFLEIDPVTNTAKPVTVKVASQAQAEAGTENTLAMSALRTRQAIDRGKEIINVTSATSSLSWDIPSGAKGFDLLFHGFRPVTQSAILMLRFGQNGAGGAFYTGPLHYHIDEANISGGSISGTATTRNQVNLSVNGANGTSGNTANDLSFEGMGEWKFRGIDGDMNEIKGLGRRGGVDGAGPTNGHLLDFFRMTTGTAGNSFNAVQILCSSGNIAKLKGVLEWTYD